jgi:hypothetical protein
MKCKNCGAILLRRTTRFSGKVHQVWVHRAEWNIACTNPEPEQAGEGK